MQIFGMRIERTHRHGRILSSGNATSDVIVTTDSKPIRKQEFESDFLVPALRCVLGSVFWSIVVGVGWYWYDSYWLAWWQIVLLFGAISALHWQSEAGAACDNQYHTVVEQKPAMVVLPEPEPLAVEEPSLLVVHGPGDQRATQATVNQRYLEDLEKFIRGCELDTSSRRWERELGREKFHQWRGVLIDLEWAQWKGNGPNAGWELLYDANIITQAISDNSRLEDRFSPTL